MTIPAARSTIIELLRNELKREPSILAAWLEGADAEERVDRFSDIDLGLIVVDGSELQTMNLVRTLLTRFAPLTLDVEVDHPHPKVWQSFFRPGHVGEFLIVDLRVQSRSLEYVFESEGEPLLVLFDRGGVIRVREETSTALHADVLASVAEIESTLPLRVVRLRRELSRGRFVDSLGAYHLLILEPLVKVLRLLYAPKKSEFHLKHATIDLPQRVVAKILELYLVKDLTDIERNLSVAQQWQESTIAAIKGRAIR